MIQVRHDAEVSCKRSDVDVDYDRSGRIVDRETFCETIARHRVAKRFDLEDETYFAKMRNSQ